MTLTYRRLGTCGRLGNQLWQIASTIGIAANREESVALPAWPYAPYFSVPDGFFTPEPHGDDADGARYVPHIAERHRPYLQDLKLWWSIKDHILAWFQPSEFALSILKTKNPGFFEVDPAKRIALHVRRGDAVGIPRLYPLQSVRYVENAMKILGGGDLFIFTDDPGWCGIHLGFTGGKVVVGNSDWEDLFLMSMCTRHAIANSSFSYWGGMLSRNPAVCYPQTWYGPDFHDLDYRLMIPDGWVAISDPEAGHVP